MLPITSKVSNEHLLELPDGTNVIAGIRHESGDVQHPFIHIRPSFSIQRYEQVRSLFSEISPLFSKFKPLALRFFAPEPIENSKIRMVNYAARAHKMLSGADWPSQKDLKLEKIEDSSYYSWYENHYQQFHKEQPELKRLVTMNPFETMEESRKSGLLYFGYYQGKLFGLIGAERSPFLGHSGLYFNEILVTKPFRREGLAQAMQREFIQTTCHSQEIIWGTIDCANSASLKTAISNKRQPVRYECVINLAEI